jgi:hypothetical protein
MGEAKRRHQKALTEFNRQVRKNHGNTEWLVLRPADLLRLMTTPNDRRRPLLRPVDAFCAKIYHPKQWPDGLPALCIACPNPVGPKNLGCHWPAAFIIELPWNWDAQGDTVSVVSTACPQCAQKTDEELVRIAANLAYQGGMTLRKIQPA